MVGISYIAGRQGVGVGEVRRGETGRLLNFGHIITAQVYIYNTRTEGGFSGVWMYG